LFDHFAFNNPAEGPIKGFPTHPHRGIETVTYMLEGNVRHRDSIGNMGVIGPGDVQWMTSGSGILHEEMPQRSENGVINGFQLWVNLPAARKMDPPRYQEVAAGGIPEVHLAGVNARIVAGEYFGVSGPVTEIAANPLYMEIYLEPDAMFELDTPPGHTAAAYLFEGKAFFGPQGEPVEAVSMVVFEQGGSIRIGAPFDRPARFMLFTGAPYGEPIVPYGPFVMNTMEEIRQTMEDLRSGNFAR